MSFLNTLTEHQRETLISLPYRVGLWVSQSDDTGGTESEATELQTLSNIINGFAYEVFGSETMQIILSDTIKHQERWPAWALRLAEVPGDCAIAVDILRTHLDEKDVNAFRNQLLEIGEAVATAFSEFHHKPQANRLSVYISFFLSRILQKPPYKSFGEYISISAEERKALKALAGALGTAYA
jgi:hypothetical protein